MSPESDLSTSTRVLRVRSQLPRSDRPSEYADDICFSPDLVASFIEAYTEPGDLVFDPFAGFGTTLRTAERLGRRALGFEIDDARVAFARRDLADPLSGYQTLDGNYARYLTDLQDIYRGIAGRAAGPDAHLVVNVANLRGTRLAWDVGNALAEILTFDREIVVDWDRPQDWFTQDYCLVFRP